MLGDIHLDVSYHLTSQACVCAILKGLETACGNRKQEAAVTRQRVIKEAAAAFRKNGIAGTGLSYGGTECAPQKLLRCLETQRIETELKGEDRKQGDQ
jgi:hypothetical protein